MIMLASQPMIPPTINQMMKLMLRLLQFGERPDASSQEAACSLSALA
jgi:hypothetical protein